MATNINNKLVCNEPHASLDSYYGPYESVHDAFVALADTTVNGVNYSKKHIGLTVGVWGSPLHTEITEYWFKGGLDESNLVVKTTEGGGLPEGIKIVTFDKNGGSGVQNSIITDTNSQVILPQCTLTKDNTEFYKWLYNDHEYNVGDVLTIGSSTVVQAIWATAKYTVSWNNGSNVTITGTSGQKTIHSGDLISAGSKIILTANPSSGYELANWINKPSGAIEKENSLVFILNSDTQVISAEVQLIPASEYTVMYSNEDEHIDTESLTAINEDSGQTVENGGKCEEGTVISFRAELKEEFKNDYYVDWSNTPEGSVITNERNLIITLNSDVNIEASSIEKENSFYYYLCNSTKAQNDGEQESGDSNLDYGDLVNGDNEGLISGGNNEELLGGDEKAPVKWFTNPKDLKECKSRATEQIDNSDSGYDILYTVRNINVPSAYNIYAHGVIKKTVYFRPLNECGDDEIITYFTEKGWIKPGTNVISGDLKYYIKDGGNYIFVAIDGNKDLQNAVFTISL